MKQKILLILIAVLIGTTITKGQTTEWKKHDVAVIYGAAPFSFRDIWDNYNSVGIFTAQYVYNPIKWLGIGAVVGYQHFYADNKHAYNSYANDITGMVVVRANWINRSNFMLYSKAGIGMVTLKEEKEDTETAAALQIPLIGTAFSLGKDFFGLAELGIGSQGWLMLGAGYRF